MTDFWLGVLIGIASTYAVSLVGTLLLAGIVWAGEQ